MWPLQQGSLHKEVCKTTAPWRGRWRPSEKCIQSLHYFPYPTFLFHFYSFTVTPGPHDWSTNVPLGTIPATISPPLTILALATDKVLLSENCTICVKCIHFNMWTNNMQFCLLNQYNSCPDTVLTSYGISACSAHLWIRLTAGGPTQQKTRHWQYR